MLPENRQVYRRIFLHFSILGILLSVLVHGYDVIFGYLFEGIHYFMEMLEQILDLLIEHTFHTSRQATQIIVFYILLVFGAVMSYFILIRLTALCKWYWKLIKTDWSDLRTAAISDWNNLSPLDKALWIGLFLMANYLASFLFF